MNAHLAPAAVFLFGRILGSIYQLCVTDDTPTKRAGGLLFIFCMLAALGLLLQEWQR